MNLQTLKLYYKQNTQTVLIVGLVLAYLVYHYYTSNKESFTQSKVVIPKFLQKKFYALDRIQNKTTGAVVREPRNTADVLEFAEVDKANHINVFIYSIKNGEFLKFFIIPTSSTQNTLSGTINKKKVVITYTNDTLIVNGLEDPNIQYYKLLNKIEKDFATTVFKKAKHEMIRQKSRRITFNPNRQTTPMRR